MVPLHQILNPHADLLAPLLYGCVEHVGSTKGLLYLRQANGQFVLASHYGWPRTATPPEILEAGNPLLVQVQRARRSFALNTPGDFPEAAPFCEGGDRVHLFLSPVYLMGDWVALLIQRDRPRQEPYDEERDGPPTLKICEALAQQLKAQRSVASSVLPPELGLPQAESPHRSGSMPMDPSVIRQLADAAPEPAVEKLSVRHDSGEIQQVAWTPEPRALPGTSTSEGPLRLPQASRRAGMFTPEHRQYFWDMAALLCRMSPMAAVALWYEDPSEIRPLLCFSPLPLTPGQLQEVHAFAAYQLPKVAGQELRILSRPGREDLPPQEGNFSTQAVLPVASETGDLLLVFRREYSPLSELDIRSLSPGLRLLQEYLLEARAHERYHHAFLSFAQRVLTNAEARLPGLRAHSLACARLCRAMALRLDLPARETEALEVAAMLHDVGTLALDPAPPAKGALSPQDRARMDTHPLQAATFLKDLDFPFDVMGLIEAHHERWDGTGYPRGLAGEAIPRGSRILALADAFESMVKGRTYKPAIPRAEAVAELEREAGRQFDPWLTDDFVAMVAAEP